VDGAAAAASIVTGLGVNLGLEAWTRWGAALDVPGPPVAAGALPSAVALAASILVLLAVTAHRNWRGIARPPDPDVARLLDG
jgi:hypothetical protein